MTARPIALARLQRPQFAPRPKKKFLIPEQPVEVTVTVTSIRSVRVRIVIRVSLTGKAGGSGKVDPKGKPSLNVGLGIKTTQK